MLDGAVVNIYFIIIVDHVSNHGTRPCQESMIRQLSGAIKLSSLSAVDNLSGNNVSKEDRR